MMTMQKENPVKKLSPVRFLTRTAILLALTLVFQQIRLIMPAPASTWVICALVNTGLMLAGGVAGLWSGLIIAVLAPLVALLQGHAAAPMVPVIMVGNAVVAAAGAFAFTGRRQWLLAVASVVKYAVIALGMALFVRKSLDAAALSAAFTAQLPQLAAFAGMAIALLVYPRLTKTLMKD